MDYIIIVGSNMKIFELSVKIGNEYSFYINRNKPKLVLKFKLKIGYIEDKNISNTLYYLKVIAISFNNVNSNCS
jgi:hypothetical protein